MKTSEIKTLARIMKENNIESLDFDDGKIKLSLKRSAELLEVKERQEKEEEKEGKSIENENKGYREIKAPLVGVFYVAKAPGEPSYVEIGDRLSKGQTVCLIEAMKTMNEIPSDFDGVVEEVCVENGQIVEYGQVLFRIS